MIDKHGKMRNFQYSHKFERLIDQVEEIDPSAAHILRHLVATNSEVRDASKRCGGLLSSLFVWGDVLKDGTTSYEYWHQLQDNLQRRFGTDYSCQGDI